MVGIYIITHNKSFKRYVGQSKDIDYRLYRHWHDLSNNKHANIHLQRAYNKYGRDAFSISTIECAEDMLTTIEQGMLSQWKNLFNICKIANVPPSAKNRTPWNKGKKMTKEHCAKLSAAQKGKKLSEETKAKIGDSWRGRKHSAETKAKISASRPTHSVWGHVEEVKALRESGLSYSKIAKSFKCDPSIVRKICLL